MNFAEFHFIRPYFLLAFIPAVLLILGLLKNKLNRGNWSSICDPALLPFVLQDRDTSHSYKSLTIGSIASLLIIIALAGPTWERLPSPVFRNDAAVVIALDLSRSMDATDISPSRLIKARYKIIDILNQRKDGQTAFLVYAGDVFTVTPLTEDNATIINLVKAVTTDIMPSQGNNTVLAIKKSIALLKQAGLQKGAILLVTDEVNLDDTLDTVQALGAYHLSILGVGTKEGAPIKDFQGGFVKDASGNIVIPKLNSNELAQLASQGNGLYSRISNDNSDIQALLKQFNETVEAPTTKTQENNNLFLDQWSDKGPWLLLLALPFAAFSFRKGLLSLTFIVLLPFPEPGYALDWQDLWSTQNQQAQQAFKQKNFQQAAEQYNDPQWKAAAQYKARQFKQVIETLNNNQTANGLYNKANALAQTGELTKAIKAYEQALKKDPKNEDAKYNKEQVEKALEKQKQQQQNQDQQKSESENSKNKDQDKQGDKSKQSDQQNNTTNEQDSADSEHQQNEQQSSDKKKEDKPESSEQSDQSKEDGSNNEEQESEQAKAQQAAEPSDYDESDQATEQWLKRIEDDPAGLLKRKFEYQYKQRARKNASQQNW